MSYQGYLSRTETSILRIDILEEGGTFNSGDNDHNAACILEGPNGYKYGIEYISIEEFANYMQSFMTFNEDIYDLLKKYSEDFDEPSIEFSIISEELIDHFEHFRCSEFNHSGSIHPFND